MQIPDVELRALQDLSPDDQMKILSIRNQDGVRKNMYHDLIIREAEHRAWLERLKDANDTKFFAVYSNGALVGGASLNAINTENKRADWAFYLDETVQGKGLGAALEFTFLDYVFYKTRLEKLNCEVLAFNEPVIRLHKKFGFVQEGVRRQHIRREEPLDVVLLGITRGEWVLKRRELAPLFNRASPPVRPLLFEPDPVECGNVFAS